MKPPFIIFALPRSRTTWLSRFLTYGEWSCGHEQLFRMRAMEDVRSWFAQGCIGSVETTGPAFWRLLPKIAPDARVVTVRRPVADVVESLVRLGFQQDAMHSAMRRLDAKLDQVETRLPGVLRVEFDELSAEEGCRRVFEHCLPYRHDNAWWKSLAQQNVQISMPALIRYFQANRPQIERFAKQAKHLILRDLQAPEQRDLDGVTFAQESFETFYRDGQRLFADHLVCVGEAPDAFAHKNLLLMRALDALGCLQIMTARCNGRMFGYLMTVLSPSLESPEISSAIHTTFYADPGFARLGMKLQRAALSTLRAKGVDELLLRANQRGDGPRLGAMYRRLGAEKCAELYLLDLKEAA